MLKRVFLGMFFLLVSINAISQLDLPPEESEPTPEAKLLIDSLVVVSKFDQYYIEFCAEKIDRESSLKGWSAEEVQKRKARIDFSKFMDYTVYNAFSSYSKQDLLDIISLMKRLNEHEKFAWAVFTNTVIESNLDLYVKSHFLD